MPLIITMQGFLCSKGKGLLGGYAGGGSKNAVSKASWMLRRFHAFIPSLALNALNNPPESSIYGQAAPFLFQNAVIPYFI